MVLVGSIQGQITPSTVSLVSSVKFHVINCSFHALAHEAQRLSACCIQVAMEGNNRA